MNEMIIFLGIMAALFGLSVLTEATKEKRDAFAFCFAASVIGIVAYKLIIALT
jgi:hypothetical protein